jgi:hypothetical protein
VLFFSSDPILHTYHKTWETGSGLMKRVTISAPFCYYRTQPRQAALIRPTMNVVTYCSTCKKRVRVGLLNISSREALKAAIESGAPIQAMHADEEGDHNWTLRAKEAEDLGKRSEQGLV